MTNKFHNPQFSCLLDSSLGGDCSFVLGGLSRILLMNKENVLTATESAITLTADTAFEMSFAPGTGGFTNEMVFSNGQRYVNQGIQFSIASKDADVLAQAEALALGKYVALCEDRSGDWYLLGRVGYGLTSSVVSLNGGLAEGDFAGLAVTMNNPCTEFAIKYTGSTPSIG